MSIAKLTSDVLKEPDRERAVMAKLNEAIDAANNASGGGTPAAGTFSTLNASGNTVLGSTNTNNTTINGNVGVNVDVTGSPGTEFTIAPSSGGSQASLVMKSGDASTLTINASNSNAASLAGTSTLSVSVPTKFTTTIGFYNTAPIAQQTGVAVTAAAIHAALVALGLITA